MRGSTTHRYFNAKAWALIATISADGLATPAMAQIYTPGGRIPDVVVTPSPSAPLQIQTQYQAPVWSAEQLNDLTASIALYPDPLLAVMLPAATYPDQIQSANLWLRDHPNPDQLSVAVLPFAPSVKSLMLYPSVLSMMADHLEWTQALGMTFVYQQPDLMNSIQYWRATAQTNGVLYTTPEQQVVAQQGAIEILPASPDVVYVPTYDPAVIFVHHDRPDRNIIRFNVGGRSRDVLDHDLDWHDHVVRVPVRSQWDRNGDGRPDVVVRDQPRDGRPNENVRVNENIRVNENGRAAPAERQVFKREDFKPAENYPQKIVTPQPDHKVITPKPTPRQAQPAARANPVPEERVTPVAPARGDSAARGNARGDSGTRGDGRGNARGQASGRD